MTTLHKLALAAGAPVAVLAGIGQSALASTNPNPPTTTSATAGGEEADVPPDWQVLVDDTGLLTLAAPPEWSDLDTAPGRNPDGSPRPWLEASTDIPSFHESFNTPGVVYLALPMSSDLRATLEEWDVGNCAAESTQDYDDGAFVGLLVHQTGCGSGSAEYYKLAANNPVRPDLTIMLQIGITGPDEQAVADTILSSFNFSPQPANPGGTLPPTSPPTTAASSATTVAASSTPAPPTTTSAPATTAAGPAGSTTPGGVFSPTGTIAPDAVRLVDDSGRISMSVPASWSEHMTSPRDGTIPRIAASPDQQAFQPAEGQPDTFSTPGVIYLAMPYETDTATALAGYTDGSPCVDGGVQPYRDGVFTGHIQQFTSCAGTSTRLFVVAANPDDRAFTAVLLVQLTAPGDADLHTVLSSFNYDAAAFAPGATTTTLPG